MKHGNLAGKSFNSKLFGNEVHCTNALLLLIKIMLCSKLYCRKGLSQSSFHSHKLHCQKGFKLKLFSVKSQVIKVGGATLTVLDVQPQK